MLSLIYTGVLITLFILGIITWITLYFIPAGYGKTIKKQWGLAINNKIGWILMEVPTLIVIACFIIPHIRAKNATILIIISFFVVHYLQRTLIFPFLLKGKSKMPLSIIALGMLFNSLNAFLIGTYLFYLAPSEKYPLSYLLDPRFICGSIVFICGMIINIHSDAYIRHLRKPGDTRHYFPHKGMYAYVVCANYLGEIIEWCGFAILSWSLPGLLFAFWTAANLVPRSDTIYKKYSADFPREMAEHHPKRIIPFIY